jgi:hypothetical protein
MDFDTFKRAVDSLTDHDGTIGIMGGEPTLHPEFERFMFYLQEKLGAHRGRSRMLRPIKDFVKEHLRRDWECSRIADENGNAVYREHGARLFSNMGRAYGKYYEIITDTCNKQVLDDHINPVYHQPGLIARKDLGIPDDAWIKLRDKCWIQDEWCASITPKGAFFCEIAAGLDMLFDGPGGWEIEPEWWRREPRDFGRQLELCEWCGFALKTFSRDSSEDIDDVSPTLYGMLQKIGGQKIRRGRVNLLKTENGEIAEESKRENKRFSSGMPYLEHYEDRFSTVNSILYVREYDVVEIEDSALFGAELNKRLKESKDWILVKSKGKTVTNELDGRIKSHVLNPGTLLYSKDDAGYMALFSKRALSLRRIGFDGVAHLTSFDQFEKKWNPSKTIDLSIAFEVPPMLKSRVVSGKRYAIWGTGMAGDQAVDAIKCAEAEIVIVVDKAESKHDTLFHGNTISDPRSLVECQSEFDYLICANYNHCDEIKAQAAELGIDPSKLLLITEI